MKIVTLNNPTWKGLDLDWDDGETEDAVIEIKLEKKKVYDEKLKLEIEN